jgi:biuret amidohydrolase
VIEDSALILIEFQREWLDEDGKLFFLMQDQEKFQSAIEAAKRMLEAVRQSEIKIVHCGLNFQSAYPELGKAQHGLREAIARHGTFASNQKGSQFSDPFVPRLGEFVVQGRTGSSGFAGSNLDSYLRNQGVTQLYLAGFALHVCIESTLRQGHDLGYAVAIIEDTCSVFNQRQRQHVLEDVVHHFGERITSEKLIQQFSNSGNNIITVN